MCIKCDHVYNPQDLECDVSVEDDNRQEWIFTLYDFDNSGKVTKDVRVCSLPCLFYLCSLMCHVFLILIVCVSWSKVGLQAVLTVLYLPLQDMSSLMHTIYDVVDASVNHSCHNKSKTLRVKLTVTPEPRCHRRETGTGKAFPAYLQIVHAVMFLQSTESINQCSQYFFSSVNFQMFPLHTTWFIVYQYVLICYLNYECHNFFAPKRIFPLKACVVENSKSIANHNGASRLNVKTK